MNEHDPTAQPPRLRFEGRSRSLAWLIPSGADPAQAPPVTPTFPPGVELMTDVSAATWVEERLVARPFATVGALVPDTFEDYARVLHPARVCWRGRSPGDATNPLAHAAVGGHTWPSWTSTSIASRTRGSFPVSP